MYKLVSKVCEIEFISKQCTSGAQEYATWETLGNELLSCGQLISFTIALTSSYSDYVYKYSSTGQSKEPKQLWV